MTLPRWYAAPRSGRSAGSPAMSRSRQRRGAALWWRRTRTSRRNGSGWIVCHAGLAPSRLPRPLPRFRKPSTRGDTVIERRRFAELGHEQLDWLDTHFHFSFAHYRDPERMNWGALRVWNDDEIAPGAGFPPHPHADMEIITYVRQGAITHKDSLGNEGRTTAGDVQVMSAGTGIRHSEYNLEAVPTT